MQNVVLLSSLDGGFNFTYFLGSEGKLTQWNDRVAVLQG